MKVFHIESGLGNQMLDYADLLASRKINPSHEHYIETILYELQQDKISMWNGYELDAIFGIKEKNIKEKFTDTQWQRIIEEVNKTKFWDTGWSYSKSIVDAFGKEGLVLKDCNPHLPKKELPPQGELSWWKDQLKRMVFRLFPRYVLGKCVYQNKLFLRCDTNDYNGHYLKFMYKNSGIDSIEMELRKAFTFPEYDMKNLEFSKLVKSCNSVAIHARRGDFLGQNSYCYKYGYFKRAVSFIRKKIENPVFVFFCDPASVEWCKENYSVFGLNPTVDKIYFVDWNVGKDSFRDMQLMADCKHNIITSSSFGWWGAYLNGNKEKITCSPDIRINTTHWF